MTGTSTLTLAQERLIFGLAIGGAIVLMLATVAVLEWRENRRRRRRFMPCGDPTCLLCTGNPTLEEAIEYERRRRGGVPR